MKPRIAIIGLKGLPAAGGSARAGENMIGQLKDRYDFTVYNSAAHTARRTGTYDGVTQVVFPALPLRSLNTLFYYVCCLLHCLLSRRYDLVHVFHLDAAFVVPFLRMRYPVVAGHRARPQEFSKWGPIARAYFNVMEWIFYKLPADAMTSVSPVIVERYQSKTRREITYIPNGVVFEELTATAGEPQDFVLFAAGRLMESKGASLFVEALHAMPYPGRAVVLGNPAHDRAYAARLAEMSQGLDVEFAGLVEDRETLFGLLRSARVVVCPSFHEGMSNMVLEAGVLARSLVCSDIPENRAIFEPDEVVFFRSGDAQDLADRLAWVLEHPEQAAERSRAGRARIERDFNWDHLGARYDLLYSDVLGDK